VTSFIPDGGAGPPLPAPLRLSQDEQFRRKVGEFAVAGS